jgi:raffinose/stachyose/melibiose transport system substrate-binding protein
MRLRRGHGRTSGLTTIAAAGALILTFIAACGSSGGGSGSGGAGPKYSGTMTYWFWGESDIPGITNWMKQRISAYEKLHPKVHINLVPQSTDTLIPAFRQAAQTNQGPDIATQWATLPTLTPMWNKQAVPVADYVPSSEISNWVGTSENIFNGKVAAVPLYLIGVPFVWNKNLFRQAGLNPSNPPKTISELLSDCKALKAHGITPIGMGNQDGYFGAWMFSLYGKQQLDSIAQLQQAMIGKQSFNQLKFNGFYSVLQSLNKQGCINSDVSSLSLTQGWQLFPQKKAAMSWTTDGNVLSWQKTLGKGVIGVEMPPRWGNGKLASTYDVTQSSDEFITSWSTHKAEAAAFLTWLHTPKNMVALYQETGAFPADKRFPTSDITDPLAKQLFQMDTQNESVWPENYLPPIVDQKADLPGGQMILSGAGTLTQVAQLWDRTISQWKTTQPVEYQNYVKWANGSS